MIWHTLINGSVICRTLKKKMTEIMQSQPEDATYEEIMRELVFEKMMDRGLSDSRGGRVVSNEEMERLLKSSVTIDILGVFHGALDIGRYLPSDE